MELIKLNIIQIFKRKLMTPKRIKIEKSETGLLFETQFYNNKKIIKVYGN
jgi:hypothetical protein